MLLIPARWNRASLGKPCVPDCGGDDASDHHRACRRGRPPGGDYLVRINLCRLAPLFSASSLSHYGRLGIHVDQVTPDDVSLGRSTDGYRPLRSADADTAANHPHHQGYPTLVQCYTLCHLLRYPVKHLLIPLPGIHQTIIVSEPRLRRRSAALSSHQRDHCHWRAGVCPKAAQATARDRAPRHHMPPGASTGFHEATETHVSLTWQPCSFASITMQSLCTGVFPMLCIGTMERFHRPASSNKAHTRASPA